jgi:hypothetical protein
MPSGFGGMGRGSDTRMYAPRSESSRMYASDDEDSYRHGTGDAEEHERRRDEKMRKREETKTVGDTPHLQITIDKPEEDPMMGDMEEPQEEEDPNMYNPEQAAAQTDMSSMAGPIGIGGPNLSQAIGAQTNGVMQQFATGEPMDDAWSSLMKQNKPHITWLSPDKGAGWIDGRINLQADLWAANNPGGYTESISDTYYTTEGLPVPTAEQRQQEHFMQTMFDEEGNLKSEPMDGAWSTLMKARDQSWQQPKYDGPPGGRKPHIATSIRSKRQSRTLSPRTEHGGLTEAPLAVEMGHLGLSTKQPLRLFPGKYRQQLGQRHQRALMGNIAMPHQPHNIEQRTPTLPGPMGSGKIPRLAGEMTGVKSRPKTVAKSELKEMNTLLKSAKDYLHISQLRRMIRDLKKIVERQDRMKKAPLSRGSNKNKESNHRGETTNPQGATDDPESDEMSSSGMPGHVFAARGSGRVA